MAGRTPTQAGRNFITPIKTAVACIFRQPLSVSAPEGYKEDAGIGIWMPDLEPIPLRTGSYGTLWVSVAISGLIIRDDRPGRGPFRVTTTQYSYQICADKDESDEIVIYHWTPNAEEGQRTFPHLHIGRSTLNSKYGSSPCNLHNLHLHTDRVSVEQFIMTLIEEFGVIPLNRRWYSVLRSSHGTFARYRTRI